MYTALCGGAAFCRVYFLQLLVRTCSSIDEEIQKNVLPGMSKQQAAVKFKRDCCKTANPKDMRKICPSKEAESASFEGRVVLMPVLGASRYSIFALQRARSRECVAGGSRLTAETFFFRCGSLFGTTRRRSLRDLYRLPPYTFKAPLCKVIPLSEEMSAKADKGVPPAEQGCRADTSSRHILF